MKLKEFQKTMVKDIFTSREAQIVGFRNDRTLINLQLHQWKKQGEIVQLKRGLYMFAEAKPPIEEVAKNLYSPCYFSLEYVLNLYGIMPEAVFAYTLVAPKPTRKFVTPLGTFYFHTIKKAAFTGFNEKLWAEPEKALVDYFYLNSHRLEPTPQFWKESRLYAGELKPKKIFHYAKLFKSPQLTILLKNFLEYAKTH